ncbi:ROK family protein [Streptomyces sp. NBC_01396]|uniref:ROK family protein n=1 Tax=Streptomyces sp. NBC_01396 TaxID=2903852 RepID=UPI003249C27A
MSSFHHETPSPSAASTAREAEVRRLIGLLDQGPSESLFQAVGMLISDASLSADEPALEAAQDGLQWLHARSSAMQKDLEQRGRLLGLIDVTHWALRRLPSGLQLSLDPDSHSARFLLSVAREPGLSNQAIAERLGVDDTEVSRLGRRLLAAGVVWRRKEWRRNYWDVTPRGQHYLETSGLLTAIYRKGSSLKFAMGVDVRPNYFTGVVIDSEGRIVARHSSPLECALDAIVPQIATFVEQLRQVAPDLAIDMDSRRIFLGVEIGGHVAQEGGIIYAPNYGLAKSGPVPVSEPVASITKMPTVLENDANALAEFEMIFGSCVDSSSFATVLIDEGIGCGLVVDGRVMHGARGGAGEVGHFVVEPEGRDCTCGNRGCLESVAGIKAIAEIARENSDQDVSDLAAVEMLLESADPKPAETAFQRAGNALGRGISAMLNFMDPEKVVLYGPSELVDEGNHPAARIFMMAVRESSQRYTFSSISREHALIPKKYTPEVGARAVASAAMRRLGES